MLACTNTLTNGDADADTHADARVPTIAPLILRIVELKQLIRICSVKLVLISLFAHREQWEKSVHAVYAIIWAIEKQARSIFGLRLE